MAFLSMFAFIISRRIPLGLASVLEFRHQSLTLKYIEIGLFLSHESSFSSPEPLGFTHHYEWLWLQPKIRIFSLANETQCALGIKLQSTAHFRRVINCNVVVFKNQRVYKRTCFSFEHFERR